MNRRLSFLGLWLSAAFVYAAVGLSASAASAQRPLQQVIDLNRQAMEAYTNLEVDQARQKLEQALEVAQRGNVSGAPLARTYLNLGIVYVGGLGDNGRGLNFFVQAIQADSSVQLDPLTSTPDIQTVFNLARSRAGSAQPPGRNPDPPARTPDPPARNPDPPPNTAGQGTLIHDPIGEQLVQTALPVFVQLAEGSTAEHVYLYYKGLGMREPRRIEMQPHAGGYGFEIPCADVFEPRMDYYIVAFGSDGTPIGFAGTAQAPLQVPIVTTRTMAAPSLPGAPAPEQCGQQEECPPGMPGCAPQRGQGGLGDTCTNASECRTGMSCEDNFCVLGGGGDDGGGDDDDDDDSDESSPVDDSELPKLFLQIGGTMGFAFASSGMLADSARPDDMTGDESPWEGCDADGGTCTVRIRQAGFVPTVALRLTGGYYFTPRIAAALSIRFQPDHGEGNPSIFAGLLIGARIQYLVTKPAVDGFSTALFVGTSYGQIQPHPPQNDVEGPYVVSGLNGAQLGAAMAYRFSKNVGIHVTPEVNLMFPTFLFDIDLTAGLELAF